MPCLIDLRCLLSLLLAAGSIEAEEAACREGNARIVFVGDSITGQGGGWINSGFTFQIRDALRGVYPDSRPDLVPLGGSGMGVGSWLALAKDPARQDRELDVKGVNVGKALSQPADVLVVMLGMNDVLAPYVSETDESLDRWQGDYRELVGILRDRLSPKVIALAAITPQTEDPATPKNRVMSRMNERIAALAKERGARFLTTNESYNVILTECRMRRADYSLAGDRIHPNQTGHLAIGIGMLNGLGERDAMLWLRRERLEPLLDGLKSAPLPLPPPSWFVADGWVLRGWQERPAEADLLSNPIDLAIERGAEFWKESVKEGGEPLKWRTFQSNLGLTDGANPDSVDFAGITWGENFEAGYGARWIRADEERHLKLELKSSGVGSVIHLTVWLNGSRLYADLITAEPKREASCEVTLKPGWNVLVFKSCHRTWQWQQSLSLTESDGAPVTGLEIRGEPVP